MRTGCSNEKITSLEQPIRAFLVWSLVLLCLLQWHRHVQIGFLTIP